MTRKNVPAGKEQLKLPLMILIFFWKYTVMLILQKWNFEIWVIIVYKAIYFSPHQNESLSVATCVNPLNFNWK